MRLESVRVLASIAVLFDVDLRPFDALAAHLNGDIDGEVYIEPPPGYAEVLFWKGMRRVLGQKHYIIYNHIQINKSLYAFPPLCVAGSEGGRAAPTQLFQMAEVSFSK